MGHLQPGFQRTVRVVSLWNLQPSKPFQFLGQKQPSFGGEEKDCIIKPRIRLFYWIFQTGRNKGGLKQHIFNLSEKQNGSRKPIQSPPNPTIHLHAWCFIMSVTKTVFAWITLDIIPFIMIIDPSFISKRITTIKPSAMVTWGGPYRTLYSTPGKKLNNFQFDQETGKGYFFIYPDSLVYSFSLKTHHYRLLCDLRQLPGSGNIQSETSRYPKIKNTLLMNFIPNQAHLLFQQQIIQLPDLNYNCGVGTKIYHKVV